MATVRQLKPRENTPSKRDPHSYRTDVWQHPVQSDEVKRIRQNPTNLLYQPHEHRTTPTFIPNHPQMFRDTLIPHQSLEPKRLDRNVYGFLCHRPVRRPFPTRNREQPRI